MERVAAREHMALSQGGPALHAAAPTAGTGTALPFCSLSRFKDRAGISLLGACLVPKRFCKFF